MPGAWTSRAARYTTASTPQTGTYNFRYMMIASAAYVTGSHALKTGVQWHIGQTWNTADANADLLQRYRDGVPDSVLVYNTPTRTYNLMGADFGLYVQDSWTLRRLTINPGLRWEHFNSSVQPMSVEGGRFVPLRIFGEIEDVPNWNNIAPRFSAVYNLTGDAKTAVKFGLNKYNRNFTTDFANRYSPTVLQTDTRNWSDCDFVRRHVDLLGAESADQPRRHRAGQRDRAEQQQQFRAGAGAASRPGPQAGLRPRIHHRRRPPGLQRRVGDRRLVPPRHPRPGAADQHARDASTTIRRSRCRARSTANR